MLYYDLDQDHNSEGIDCTVYLVSWSVRKMQGPSEHTAVVHSPYESATRYLDECTRNAAGYTCMSRYIRIYISIYALYIYYTIYSYSYTCTHIHIDTYVYTHSIRHTEWLTTTVHTQCTICFFMITCKHSIMTNR